MDELIQLVAKTYGIAGLIMLSPFVAVVFLWKHNIALQNKLETSQEKRIKDAQAVADKLITVATTQSSLSKETNMALENVGDALSLLTVRRLGGDSNAISQE